MVSLRTPNRASPGFSLIEVLVAVVVLAVGLLALATLQLSLTRASAEAKVRGRVAAMLTARMDSLRNQGYGTLASAAVLSTEADDCDPASPDAGDWIDCTRAQAALGSLDFNQAVQTFSGAASFLEQPPADPRMAQFKRITLTASWTDAAGGNHQIGIASDVSALALTNMLVPPPDDLTTGAGGPVVRTLDPATAGVIPIALGTDAASATSNPVPELVGQKKNQQIVGTKFTVLNYTPPSDGSVVIRKRFENELIKCSCQYGAGGNNLPEIYRTAQWPAIWTGERYDVHVPATPGPAPGQARNAGPRPGALQSPLCQECCRDHHDTGAAGSVRFDPERSDGVGKYDADAAGALTAVVDTVTGTYVNACRVIRVDGFWRTAADMYARQYGLLETQPVAGVAAKSGLPTDPAVGIYTDFVTGFLSLYDGSSGLPAVDGQARFDATAGIDAPTIVIPQASNSDYRYLHGRALYVDHLEEQARTKLSDVLADTGEGGLCPEGTAAKDCVMPFLPFTAANLTEIAKWEQVGTPGILSINSGNLLATDPVQPSGGRTIGIAVGTAENRSSVRRSNSGIAVNTVLATVAGVDPDDNGDPLDDTQRFDVFGTAGPGFDVRVEGGGANPFVYFTLGSDVDRECFKPAGSPHHCVTATGTLLPQAGSVRIAGYWIETTTSQPLSVSCAGEAATATVAVPTFHNFEVTAATIDGIGGSIAAPLNDNTDDESTTVAFAAVPENGLVVVTLGTQGGSPTYATIGSCTTNLAGDEINDIVWIRPWTQP
jgi:type IV pilus modification protein PilV